jgi:hypothetical protein
MKLEVFEKIITAIKEQSEKSHKLYELGVDLIEFTEGYDKIWSLLLKTYYGKEGEDWITWFIFERDDRNEDPNQAWDENNNPICYDIPSLWKHVEEIRCSIDFVEYELPVRNEPTDTIFEGILGIRFK